MINDINTESVEAHVQHVEGFYLKKDHKLLPKHTVWRLCQLKYTLSLKQKGDKPNINSCKYFFDSTFFFTYVIADQNICNEKLSVAFYSNKEINNNK